MARFGIFAKAIAINVALTSVFTVGSSAYAASAQASAVGAARRATLSEFVRSRSYAPFAAMPRFAASAWLRGEAVAAARRGGSNLNLLYVSAAPLQSPGPGVVNIYLAGLPGGVLPLVGQIRGLDTPGSLAVDPRGTLYVTQIDAGAPVLVFPLGAARPSLRLDTLGEIAGAVAAGDDGKVFVGTATGDILVYRRGATVPSIRFAGIAGDGVAAIATDVRGNIYYAGDFFSSGTVVAEITPSRSLTLARFPDFANGLLLDSEGKGLTIRGLDELYVYAPKFARLLRKLPISGFQSMTLNRNDTCVFTATGDIFEYAYPGGRLLGTLRDLENYNTFGMATFPASPLARP